MRFLKKKEDIGRIYKGFSSAEKKQISKAGIQQWFAKGSPIFRKGQTGKEMYIIEDGAVHIVDDTVSPPQRIALLRQGELFGELSLSTKSTRRSSQAQSLKRSASAIAAKDSTMFVVEEETFNDLLYNHPDIASKLLMNLFYVIGERLSDYIKGKLIDENIAAPKLLRGFKEPEKRRLLKFSKIIALPKGKPLFIEGQESEEMYYVLSGAIEITKKAKGRRQRLAIMGEGDLFGELGLITGKGRMASAVALSNADLLAMSEGGLQKLRKKNPEIATKLFHNLFRITTARLRSLIVPVIGA